MSKRFEPWEVTAIVVCALISGVVVWIEYQCECLTGRYPLFYSGVLGLASGVVGTIIVIWLQRWHSVAELGKQYRPLAGAYRRFDIGQDNTPDGSLDNIRARNNDLPINLHYVGGSAFRIDARYWNDLGCQVEAHIEFVESNRMVATGRYRYLEGCEFSGHFGTYTVYRMQEDDNRLLVLYHHVFPRMNINNPDANRGWEIWERAGIPREG